MELHQTGLASRFFSPLAANKVNNALSLRNCKTSRLIASNHFNGIQTLGNLHSLMALPSEQKTYTSAFCI